MPPNTGRASYAREQKLVVMGSGGLVTPRVKQSLLLRTPSPGVREERNDHPLCDFAIRRPVRDTLT